MTRRKLTRTVRNNRVKVHGKQYQATADMLDMLEGQRVIVGLYYTADKLEDYIYINAGERCGFWWSSLTRTP